MKKSAIIAFVIVLILIVTGIIVFVRLNKEKKSITTSDFYSIMSQKEYNVVDATNQFAGYDYVKQASIAVNKNNTYQIEFYELEDDDSAIYFYNYNKSIVEESKGSSSAETKVELKNHAKYTLSTNGKYKVVSRINNTVIYLNVDEAFKDTVKNLLKELGY